MPTPTDAHDQRFKAFYSGSRVCVTGGAGFIGGHIAQTLLEYGAHVTILDDLSTGSIELVGEFLDRFPNTARFVQGSILEPSALSDAVRGSSLVFHQAAMVSVPMSIESPQRCMDVNATGTTRVAEACRASSVARWVYAASSSAYGDALSTPNREDAPPRPLSPYAVAKLTGEHIVTAWAQSYALDGVSLRYFNIFGERQPDDSPYSAVIAKFAAQLRANKPITIFGDGAQTRDFTHVSNAVLANLLAGSSPEPLNGAVLNVGCGHPTTVNELLALLARELNIERPNVTHADPRTGDVRHSLADLSRTRERLGYEPATTLSEGIDLLLHASAHPGVPSVAGKIA